MLSRLLGAACLILLGGCSSPEAPPPDPALPTLAALQDGWNAIAPGGETRCSQGTDYTFYARPADPDKVVLFFQGGGACWFGEICDLTRNPTYDPLVDDEDDPSRYHGIFALDHPENPFADYSMVFVPYCTGDVHIGNRTTTYDVPATDSTEAGTVSIHHAGFVNSQAVLAWMYSAFDDPETIFVTGSSAGSIPSPFYADLVATHYTEARVVQLGDASGGYGSDSAADLNQAWGVLSILPDVPEYAGYDQHTLNYQVLYQVASKRHPDVIFAQYDNAYDDVQRRFIELSGIQDVDLLAQMKANQDVIRAEAPGNFHVYVPGGDMHTIMGRPEFYTVQVGGQRFRDWVAALAAGETVADVMCDACDTMNVVPAD